MLTMLFLFLINTIRSKMIVLCCQLPIDSFFGNRLHLPNLRLFRFQSISCTNYHHHLQNCYYFSKCFSSTYIIFSDGITFSYLQAFNRYRWAVCPHKHIFFATATPPIPARSLEKFEPKPFSVTILFIMDVKRNEFQYRLWWLCRTRTKHFKIDFKTYKTLRLILIDRFSLLISRIWS